MLSPRLRSVLRSLLSRGKEDADETVGWLLLSIDDDEEFVALPIVNKDTQSIHLESWA